MSRHRTGRGRHRGGRSPETKRWHAAEAELAWLKLPEPEAPVKRDRKKPRPKPVYDRTPPQSAPPRPAWLSAEAYSKLIALRSAL